MGKVILEGILFFLRCGLVDVSRSLPFRLTPLGLLSLVLLPTDSTYIENYEYCKHLCESSVPMGS